MHQHNPGAVVLKYVEWINKGDAEGVASLTAEEFVFIDKTTGSHVSPEVEARSTVL